TVRDRNEGDQVSALELEHYPGMTEASIHQMIDAARKDFVESCKLDPDLFFADAFTSAAD
ncbi:MAG: hypothetical protein EB006_13885, partial [Betaproteobacteria bacterium]|nr:hypothetical protein [Betaproteobacteria bacterium]